MPLKFITVRDSPAAYHQLGNPEGMPVILVHGFRGDHHGLLLIAQEIIKRHPEILLITPDLPGFGESPSLPGSTHNLTTYGEWFAEFATSMAPGGSLVVAHSFGTLVTAQALAVGYSPQTVALVNPISSPALQGPRKALTKLAIAYYRAGKILPAPLAETLLAHPLIVRVMSEVMAKTGEGGLRRWIHQQHAQYFSGYSNRTTLLDAFEASVSHTVMEFSDSFTMPTVVIAGNKDDITPLHTQLTLARTVAGGDLHVLPGVGHLSHYEAPHDVAEIICEFWERQT